MHGGGVAFPIGSGEKPSAMTSEQTWWKGAREPCKPWGSRFQPEGTAIAEALERK